MADHRTFTGRLIHHCNINLYKNVYEMVKSRYHSIVECMQTRFWIEFPLRGFKGSSFCILKIRVNTDSTDERKKYYITDFFAQTLLNCGVEDPIHITGDDGVVAVHRFEYPNIRPHIVRVEEPNAEYKVHATEILVPYETFKRMYEMFVPYGDMITLNTETLEKYRFIKCMLPLMVLDSWKDLYNKYTAGSTKLDSLRYLPYPLNVEILNKPVLEQHGYTVLDLISLVVVRPGDTDPSIMENATFEKGESTIITVPFESIKELYIHKSAAAHLERMGIMPEGLNYTSEEADSCDSTKSHTKTLVQYLALLEVLMIQKSPPDRPNRRLMRYMTARKQALYATMSDPNSDKDKLESISSVENILDSARFLHFYPYHYRNLYTTILASKSDFSKHLTGLLSYSKDTMFNMISKFICSPVKTKLHCYSEVVCEMPKLYKAYTEVCDLIGKEFVQYYKLYYPNGHLTDCNKYRSLCFAAYTWMWHSNQVSLVNYGMANSYFSRYIVRVFMQKVPDEMYAYNKPAWLQEVQDQLALIPEWNIDHTTMAKKDTDGKKVIVFPDIDEKDLQAFYDDFNRRLRTSTGGIL